MFSLPEIKNRWTSTTTEWLEFLELLSGKPPRTYRHVAWNNNTGYAVEIC